MPRGGKSRVEVEAELAAFNAKGSKTRKDQRWYVCYFYKDKPEVLWMMNARGRDEETAWEFVKHKLRNEKNFKDARLKYAKNVEPEDPERIRKKRAKAQEREEEENDE